MELADHHEQGDDAAVKQHGEDDDLHVNVPRVEAVFALGERIGHGHREKHINESAEDDTDDGDQEGSPELRISQQLLISGDVEVLRDQAHLVGRHGVASGEGDGHHV